MERWHRVCLLLCIVGILKEFRPSEPYVTKFIINYKNVTRDEVTHVIYPIATYTYLATLPLIFLITDYLRHKTVVIFECVSFVACYILLIWGKGITNLMVLEVFYGFASSAEVAYYTYIYAKVDRENFKKVTSYVHTAIIIGNLVAALSAQTLISTQLLDIRQLNFITLGSCVGAFILACFLPNVQKSLYFHNTAEEGNQEDNNRKGHAANAGRNRLISSRGHRVGQPFKRLLSDFKMAYSNVHVLKWSIWWALAAAGNQMIRNYVQALWEAVADGVDTSSYNGVVDAVHTFLSTFLALGVGYTKIKWSKYGEPFLSVMCFLQAGLLIWMSLANSLLIAYLNYIFLRVSFQVMITAASAEVALQISPDSYGLIFGINRFLTLIFQTILTLVINDESGLALSERSAFLAYGFYHMGIALCYALAYFLRCLQSTSKTFLPETNNCSPENKSCENYADRNDESQSAMLTREKEANSAP